VKDKQQQQQRKNGYLCLPAGFGCEAVAQIRGDLSPVFARNVYIKLPQNHTEELALQVGGPFDHFEIVFRGLEYLLRFKCQIVEGNKNPKLESGRGKR
jgi:hypothetical protein